MLRVYHQEAAEHGHYDPGLLRKVSILARQNRLEGLCRRLGFALLGFLFSFFSVFAGYLLHSWKGFLSPPSWLAG